MSAICLCSIPPISTSLYYLLLTKSLILNSTYSSLMCNIKQLEDEHRKVLLLCIELLLRFDH